MGNRRSGKKKRDANSVAKPSANTPSVCVTVTVSPRKTACRSVAREPMRYAPTTVLPWPGENACSAPSSVAASSASRTMCGSTCGAKSARPDVGFASAARRAGYLGRRSRCGVRDNHRYPGAGCSRCTPSGTAPEVKRKCTARSLSGPAPACHSRLRSGRGERPAECVGGIRLDRRCGVNDDFLPAKSPGIILVGKFEVALAARRRCPALRPTCRHPAAGRTRPVRSAGWWSSGWRAVAPAPVDHQCELLREVGRQPST